MRHVATPLAGLACLLAAAPAARAQEKASVAVAPFTYHEDVRAEPGAEIETATLTSKFVTALVQTRKFDVVERERLDAALDEMELSEAGLTDPDRAVEAGRVVGADYILMGEISVFTLTTDVRPIPHTDRWVRNEELTLIVDMRIVESRTSKIVSAEKGEVVYEGQQHFRSRPDADAPVEPSTLDSIQRDVVDQLVLEVINAVYPVKIISVDGRGGVAVNRGEGGGLETGDVLDVFSEGEAMVDPDTGEVLGHSETKVARIRITQILAKFSKGRVVGGTPERGNVCRPASGPADFARPEPPADTRAPRIEILAPKAGATLNGNPVTVAAEVTDEGRVERVKVSGQDASRDPEGYWTCRVRARDGRNRVTVEAWDGAGNKSRERVVFSFDETPPEVDADATILVEGTVDDLDCTLTINGKQVSYDSSTGDYSVRVPPHPDHPDKVRIVATDRFGNESVEVRDVR